MKADQESSQADSSSWMRRYLAFTWPLLHLNRTDRSFCSGNMTWGMYSRPSLP